MLFRTYEVHKLGDEKAKTDAVTGHASSGVDACGSVLIGLVSRLRHCIDIASRD